MFSQTVQAVSNLGLSLGGLIITCGKAIVAALNAVGLFLVEKCLIHAEVSGNIINSILFVDTPPPPPYAEEAPLPQYNHPFLNFFGFFIPGLAVYLCALIIFFIWGAFIAASVGSLIAYNHFYPSEIASDDSRNDPLKYRVPNNSFLTVRKWPLFFPFSPFFLLAVTLSAAVGIIQSNLIFFAVVCHDVFSTIMPLNEAERIYQDYHWPLLSYFFSFPSILSAFMIAIVIGEVMVNVLSFLQAFHTMASIGDNKQNIDNPEINLSLYRLDAVAGYMLGGLIGLAWSWLCHVPLMWSIALTSSYNVFTEHEKMPQASEHLTMPGLIHDDLNGHWIMQILAFVFGGAWLVGLLGLIAGAFRANFQMAALSFRATYISLTYRDKREFRDVWPHKSNPIIFYGLTWLGGAIGFILAASIGMVNLTITACIVRFTQTVNTLKLVHLDHDEPTTAANDHREEWLKRCHWLPWSLAFMGHLVGWFLGFVVSFFNHTVEEMMTAFQNAYNLLADKDRNEQADPHLQMGSFDLQPKRGKLWLSWLAYVLGAAWLVGLLGLIAGAFRANFQMAALTFRTTYISMTYRDQWKFKEVWPKKHRLKSFYLASCLSALISSSLAGFVGTLNLIITAWKVRHNDAYRSAKLNDSGMLVNDQIPREEEMRKRWLLDRHWFAFYVLASLGHVLGWLTGSFDCFVDYLFEQHRLAFQRGYNVFADKPHEGVIHGSSKRHYMEPYKPRSKTGLEWLSWVAYFLGLAWLSKGLGLLIGMIRSNYQANTFAYRAWVQYLDDAAGDRVRPVNYIAQFKQNSWAGFPGTCMGVCLGIMIGGVLFNIKTFAYYWDEIYQAIAWPPKSQGCDPYENSNCQEATDQWYTSKHALIRYVLAGPAILLASIFGTCFALTSTAWSLFCRQFGFILELITLPRDIEKYFAEHYHEDPKPSWGRAFFNFIPQMLGMLIGFVSAIFWHIFDSPISAASFFFNHVVQMETIDIDDESAFGCYLFHHAWQSKNRLIYVPWLIVSAPFFALGLLPMWVLFTSISSVFDIFHLSAVFLKAGIGVENNKLKFAIARFNDTSLNARLRKPGAALALIIASILFASTWLIRNTIKYLVLFVIWIAALIPSLIAMSFQRHEAPLPSINAHGEYDPMITDKEQQTVWFRIWRFVRRVAFLNQFTLDEFVVSRASDQTEPIEAHLRNHSDRLNPIFTSPYERLVTKEKAQALQTQINNEKTENSPGRSAVTSYRSYLWGQLFFARNEDRSPSTKGGVGLEGGLSVDGDNDQVAPAYTE